MKKFLIITILGVIFTAIFTWPFVTKIPTNYSDTDDYGMNGWILWYSQKAITEGKIFNQFQYFQTNQFYPLPYNLAYSEHLFFPSLIFTIIYLTNKNVILSLNIIVFLTYIFNFVSIFYVLSYLLKLIFNKTSKNTSRIFFLPQLSQIVEKRQTEVVSIVAALIYTFNPLTAAHAGGHLQLLHKYFIPLLFLSAFKYLSSPSFKKALFFFAIFTLNALSSFYFQVFSLLTLAVFSIPFLINYYLQKQFSTFGKLIKTSLIGVLFLPILLYFNLPYFTFSKLENISRSVQENIHYSARILDWLAPNPNSFLYHDLAFNLLALRNPKETGGQFNWSEHTLTLNTLPLFLLLISFLFLINRKKTLLLKQPVKLLIVANLLLLITTFIFTFGPYFLGFNGLSAYTKLPYYYLFTYLPFLASTRVPTRIQFFFYFPFTFFISIGLYYLFNHFKRFNVILLSLLITFIFIENFIPKNYDSNSATISYLSSHNQFSFLKNKNTIHLPIYTEELTREVAYLNWSTITGENMFNGYSGYFPSDWIAISREITAGEKSDLIDQMKALGINYVIVHKDQPDLQKLNYLSMVQKTFEDDKIIIYNLDHVKTKMSSCSETDTNLIVQPLYYKKVNGKFRDKVAVLGILKNLSPCYLVNKGTRRYQTSTFFLDQATYSLPIKLPLLLEPNKEYNFSSKISL